MGTGAGAGAEADHSWLTFHIYSLSFRLIPGGGGLIVQWWKLIFSHMTKRHLRSVFMPVILKFPSCYYPLSTSLWLSLCVSCVYLYAVMWKINTCTVICKSSNGVWVERQRRKCMRPGLSVCLSVTHVCTGLHQDKFLSKNCTYLKFRLKILFQ
jgi:hypothetical protein